MNDWTTCRVVRDRDGDLWFRGCDSDDLWTANTNYPDVFLTTDEVLTVFGPLTPVLDADGLPVVHTVGELAEKAAGEPIPFDDSDLYAEVVDGALDAAAERDALAAKVERVRALHRAVGIYDECDCDAPDPATHLDVDDVGLTCNLMYRVCAECCRDDVYQTEGCASYHAHRLDEDYHCPTIRALDEEPQQ